MGGCHTCLRVPTCSLDKRITLPLQSLMNVLRKIGPHLGGSTHVYSLGFFGWAPSWPVGNIKIKKAGTFQEARWQSLDLGVSVGCAAWEEPAVDGRGLENSLEMNSGTPALDKLGTASRGRSLGKDQLTIRNELTSQQKTVGFVLFPGKQTIHPHLR